MARAVVGTENGADIEIYYEDHGTGRPVVLIHGYALDGRSWERQERALLGAGYRVVAYDRRGFGRSSRPASGYDYDTLADDLRTLLEHLDLEEVVLTGFGMGTGEVARYLGRYGSARVRKAVMIAAIAPYLLRTAENPYGVDLAVVEGARAAIADDRYAYLEEFLNDGYNVDVYGGTRISDQAWHAAFIKGTEASPVAILACVDCLLTDFREDLHKLDVPLLAVHGTEDRILPIGATTRRLQSVLDNVQVVAVDGGPHNITWTHADEVNSALLAFLE